MTDLADISRQLAEQLKAYRLNENLTQVELAAILEVSLRSVQDYEAQAALPRAKTRRKIAALLAAAPPSTVAAA